MNSRITVVALLAAAGLASGLAAARIDGAGGADETVRLSPVSSGAMKQIGYYMPNRLELSPDKPATLKKAPDGLEAPLYGVLPIAGAKDVVFHVIVDEPAGKPARLFVDTNGNGDLTDDVAADWGGKPQGAEKKYTMYSGSAAGERSSASAEGHR